MYYIKCSTTKYYEGEQRQIKAKQKSMSKHTIDLYTINYRVIIIKNSWEIQSNECLKWNCFPPLLETTTNPVNRDIRKQTNNKTPTHTQCVRVVYVISLFLSLQVYNVMLIST